ncbi:hypothetical protein, partial [Pseudomonas syringae]
SSVGMQVSTLCVVNEDAERLERRFHVRSDSLEAHETSFILPPPRCKPRHARAAEDRSVSDHWGT